MKAGLSCNRRAFAEPCGQSLFFLGGVLAMLPIRILPEPVRMQRTFAAGTQFDFVRLIVTAVEALGSDRLDRRQ